MWDKEKIYMTLYGGYTPKSFNWKVVEIENPCREVALGFDPFSSETDTVINATVQGEMYHRQMMKQVLFSERYGMTGNKGSIGDPGIDGNSTEILVCTLVDHDLSVKTKFIYKQEILLLLC